MLFFRATRAVRNHGSGREERRPQSNSVCDSIYYVSCASRDNDTRNSGSIDSFKKERIIFYEIAGLWTGISSLIGIMSNFS